MRNPLLPLVMSLLCVVSSLPSAADSVAPPSVVYLDGPKSLAALRQANPTHYARAERIIAAAGELCKPGALDAYYARFQASDISCEQMLLKTSNPPKKQLTFKLDDTLYLALVTMTDAAGKVMPIGR